MKSSKINNFIDKRLLILLVFTKYLAFQINKSVAFIFERKKGKCISNLLYIKNTKRDDSF